MLDLIFREFRGLLYYRFNSLGAPASRRRVRFRVGMMGSGTSAECRHIPFTLFPISDVPLLSEIQRLACFY